MNSNRLWLGIVLIVLGVLFLLDNAGVLGLGDIIHTYWPVVLILWGISIMRGRRRDAIGFNETSHEVFGDRERATRTDQVHHSVVFGDISVQVESQSFKGGSVSAVFGNARIDLSRSALSEGESLLKISSVFGNAFVQLPQGTAFALTANTVFGDIQCDEEQRRGFSQSLQYVSPSYLTTTKKIHIQASQVFGNITIRSSHGQQ